MHTYVDDTLCSTEFSESERCKNPLASGDLMLISVVYRSPNCDSVNFGHLCTFMNLAFNSSVSHVLVSGDFNMPHIDWNSWTVACESSMEAEFLNLIYT